MGCNARKTNNKKIYMLCWYAFFLLTTASTINDRYTGRFIMFSVITNTYNKKTKGHTLMEFFTATGKLKKFFLLLTTRDVRCVHQGWHGTHRYDIQVLVTYASACVARTWISYRCVSCHTWCTHRTSLVVNKKNFQFSCGCEKFH
jgi:hypothetical protein